METFWDIIAPIYGAVIAILVPIALAYALKLLRDKTGIEIEAKDREALQSALQNAALSVLRKQGTAALTSMAEDTIVNYVRDSVPDAVRRLGKGTPITDATILKLAAPKLEAAAKAGEAPAVPSRVLATRREG
ncbi:hypothetical protein [Aurantimonas sp. 22II-16-19i]|uniref:hypothetical protein n=1 Tax=Aurantimonas sp. 22II-16-19i TaxID=1317114 RepID=UPI0009F7FAE8|nr:hypothetical protein [Aurantimonas sp. 22II-16-19i]ORE89727.1 hypothetical protein ATO4_23652 [Aurantimonas sp. 22II-16-19i]